MASDDTPAARLMLAVEAGDGARERVAAVMAAVNVASVIVMPPAGRALVPTEIVPLVGAVQTAGAAALIADDATVARAVRADGVHLGFSEDPRSAYETARAIVGGRAIVGADAGRSRHDAMSLGELAADYVAFGVPAFVKDRETAFERQLDLIAWWAEIFEVPCVAMDVAEPEQAAALAAAGADFVSLRLEAGLAVAEAVERAKIWSSSIDSSRRPEA